MKLSSFCSCILLVLVETVTCYERSFEVKFIERATESEFQDKNFFYIVLTGNDGLKFKTNDLPEEKRILLCEEGKEAVQKEANVKYIQTLESNRSTKETTTYLFWMKKKIYYYMGLERWSTSIVLLPAFMCPTLPTLYIHLNELNEENGYMKLFAIYKGSSLHPSLSDIRGLLMNSADEVEEAYFDKIETVPFTSLHPSSMDVDELLEDERLQMCYKAVQMIPNSSVMHANKSAHIGRSKYYLMKLVELASSAGTTDLADSSAMDETTATVEAFLCPTDPEIYIHLSDEGRNGHVICVIAKQTEPLFFPSNIVAYLVKSVTQVEEVSLENVRDENGQIFEKSATDFDSLEQGERRELCQMAVKVLFGSSVTLIQDAEIERSKFYKMWPPVTVEAAIQAMQCSTNSATAVYIHITKRPQGGKVMWVVVEKNDISQPLFIWSK